jgi:hypothetical protein
MSSVVGQNLGFKEIINLSRRNTVLPAAMHVELPKKIRIRENFTRIVNKN